MTGGCRRRDDHRQGFGQDHQAREVFHALEGLRCHGAADALRPVPRGGATEAQGSRPCGTQIIFFSEVVRYGTARVYWYSSI